MSVKALTVQDVKNLLATLPDDALVLLSKDEAGNGFSPACSYSTGTYVSGEKPWQPGMLYDEGDSVPGSPRAKKAIALWPMN